MQKTLLLSALQAAWILKLAQAGLVGDRLTIGTEISCEFCVGEYDGFRFTLTLMLGSMALLSMQPPLADVVAAVSKLMNREPAFQYEHNGYTTFEWHPGHEEEAWESAKDKYDNAHRIVPQGDNHGRETSSERLSQAG